MFDRAIHETARRGYEHITYARFADDIVIAVNGHDSLKWLVEKCFRRLSEEMNKLKVKLNTQKTKIVNVNNNETFTFLGFEYRKITMNNGKKLIQIRPPKDKVKKYMTKIGGVI